MKKGWEKRFDEMWYDPMTTLTNWSGLFKEPGIVEQVVGSIMGVHSYSASETEQMLKKSVGDFIKIWIKSELV